MELSTSSNIHASCGSRVFSLCESIEACWKAGYRVMDITTHAYTVGADPILLQPGWRDWVKTVGEQLEHYPMRLNQSHGTFFLNRGDWDEQAYIRCIERSIEVAGMLGIPWMVLHPICGIHVDGMDDQQIIQTNVEFSSDSCLLWNNGEWGWPLRTRLSPILTMALCLPGLPMLSALP